MPEKSRKQEDEDKEATLGRIEQILNAFPSYEDYISGKIKAYGFLYHSKTKRTHYMWTTIEEDAEEDQAYFEDLYGEGDLFDTIAIFKLHKIIKWGKQKEDAEDESE